MNKTVVGLIVILVLLELLGVPQVRFIQIGLVIFYGVVMGLAWLFTGRKPGRQNVLILLGLVLGPVLLIALGTDLLVGLRNLMPKHALTVVLLLILAVICGPQLVKKQRK